MKLRRIEILGFKSFRTKVGVEIGDGVTAVVGPNGCGKSNIVDAIRWAMGSQSPRDLRGRAMEDIIFGGSENHRPMGFAEVSLSFDNDPEYSLLPLEWRDQQRITVTRRLFRNGDSDYEINGSRARLRDIHDVFAGTGVSSRDAYSIIEQGRIGFVVNALPAERRVMIEEAAGITRYKNQRKVAERRLEKTTDNLLRIGDVVREVHAQTGRLERQAQRAMTAKRMQERCREIDMIAHAETLRNAEASRLRTVEAYRVADTERQDSQRLCAIVDTQYEALRVDMQTSETVANQAAEAAYQIRAHVDLLEANIAHREREALLTLRRREEAESRLAEDSATLQTLVQEYQDLVDATHHAVQHDDGMMSTLTQLEQTRAQWRDRVVAASKALNIAREELSAIERTIARTSTRADALRSELRTIEAREQDAAASRQQMEHDVQEMRDNVASIRSALTQAQEQYETATKRLQESKDEERTRQQALQQLRDRAAQSQETWRKSEAALHAMEQVIASGAGLSAAVTKVLERARVEGISGVLGPLVERLRIQEGAEDRAVAILDDWMDAVIVENDTVALRLLAFAHEEKQSLKVLALRAPFQGEIGSWVEAIAPIPMGLVQKMRSAECVEELRDDMASLAVDDRRFWTDGQGAFAYRAEQLPAEQLVALRRDLEHARTAATRAQEDWQTVETECTDAQQRFAAAQETQRERQAQCEEHEAIIRRHRIELDDALTRVQHVERQLRLLVTEHAHAQERGGAIREELTQNLTANQQADAQREQTHQRANEAQEAYREADEQRQRTEEEWTRLKVEKAKRDTERQHAIAQKDRVEREMQATRTRIDQTTKSLQESEGDNARLDVQTTEDKRALVIAKEKRIILDQQAATTRKAFEDMRVQVRELEITLAEHRKENARVEQEWQRTQLLVERVKDELQAARTHTTEHFGCSAEALLDQMKDVEWTDALKKERRDLHHKLEALGPVNPAAEEEYAAAMERLRFLEEQKKDLETAMDDLTRALQKMDQTCKQLFEETFHQVNARFQEMFPRLFRGGNAHLTLTEPGDLLGTGVEIVAQPPGKRLQNLSLFSGGEKALTAAALIFAIFELRPSPICILDEVDAPLDEANVGRFADMVREISARSQFLVITHNTRTMEAADTLYGVTMQEAGVSQLVGVDLKSTRGSSLSAASGVS